MKKTYKVDGMSGDGRKVAQGTLSAALQQLAELVRRHSQRVLELAVEGANHRESGLLRTGGNAPRGLALDVVHRAQQAHVVDIVGGCLVQGGMAEEVNQSRLRGADKLSQLCQSEVGVLVGQFLFHPSLYERHQLVIVAQVGVLDEFLMANHQFLEHLHSPAHVVEGVHLLAQLQVAVHQVEIGLLQNLHVVLQFFNLLFVFGLIHSVVIVVSNLLAKLVIFYQINKQSASHFPKTSGKAIPQHRFFKDLAFATATDGK